MTISRRTFALGGLALPLLSACKADYSRADDASIRRAFYKADGPPSISILSMVLISDDVSEHTGILISGDQRVLYDPAGSFRWAGLARADDIHYGMTDELVQTYKSYHARDGYYVETLTKEVPLEVANLAIRLSQEQGTTLQTQCAISASKVLRQLPGFGNVGITLFPQGIREDVKQIPGMTMDKYYENDSGQNYAGVNRNKPETGRGEG